ncbi:SsgA family sporulation/cell division regulator [Micromonospora sp. WMMD1102]|uniref:SsgA family sporulation/cell division regulator n=1 Tax=Micromonospora sp. WMMD1102 TaxID=3016105 RepID=UPI00241584AC|nr:SsgA family sporulation/cell division regulator [Micromonospora sp. WMMD1102]MDG4791986.1 SsgA family sporulation/cell division regulator [Micromonospora sp. WMMD1102]
MSVDGRRIARRVSACMRIQVRVADLDPAPHATAVLIYDPADPLMVRLVLDEQEANPWHIGRDLLADGLATHAGFGDVRVWPLSTPDGDVLYVVLATPEDPDYWALLEFPAPEVRRFLNRAYRQVPRGTEANLIDLDWLVARLLTETP